MKGRGGAGQAGRVDDARRHRAAHLLCAHARARTTSGTGCPRHVRASRLSPSATCVHAVPCPPARRCAGVFRGASTSAPPSPARSDTLPVPRSRLSASTPADARRSHRTHVRSHTASSVPCIRASSAFVMSLPAAVHGDVQIDGTRPEFVSGSSRPSRAMSPAPPRSRRVRESDVWRAGRGREGRASLPVYRAPMSGRSNIFVCTPDPASVPHLSAWLAPVVRGPNTRTLSVADIHHRRHTENEEVY